MAVTRRRYAAAMKPIKWLLALLGLAAVAGAGVGLFRFGWDMQEIIGAAQRYDSARVIANPVTTTVMIAGVTLAAGLLLGLGLGLPNRTSGQIRRATLDEVNSGRSAAIATKASQRSALPEGPEGQA